jgi:hypothetical protein
MASSGALDLWRDMMESLEGGIGQQNGLHAKPFYTSPTMRH